MMFRIATRALLAAFALSALALAPATAQDADHGGHADHASTADIVLGDIVISRPFTRATLPNAPVAGGFLTLANTGGAADRLVAVETPLAREAQIHEMAMEGEVMKMRQIPDGLPIGPGETVALEPGGYHLMFMGLTSPLVEGETLEVTLTFEKAGTVTIDLPIAGTAAGAPDDHSAHHGH